MKKREKYILMPPEKSLFKPLFFLDKEEAERKLEELNNRIKFWAPKETNLWTVII